MNAKFLQTDQYEAGENPKLSFNTRFWRPCGWVHLNCFKLPSAKANFSKNIWGNEW